MMNCGKVLIVFVCTLLLSTSLGQAQGIVKVHFRATVTGITVPGSVVVPESDISNGDLVIGSILYERKATRTVTPDRGTLFELEGMARFDVQTGDYIFSSQLPVGSDLGHSYSARFSKLERPAHSEPGFNCWLDFEYSLDNTESSVPLQSISIWGVDVNCDDGYDDAELPASMHLSDWDQMSLRVGFIGEDETHYNLSAKITALYTVGSNLGTISGRVYQDQNSNCIADDEAAGPGNQFLNFEPGGYVVPTNQDGEYDATLPLGEYSVTLLDNQLWNIVCREELPALTLSQEGQQIEANLAVEPERLVEFLEVSVAGSQARPGSEINYTIRLQNAGTLPYSGTLSFEHDSMLSEFSSSLATDNYSAPVAEWELADLPPGAIRTINISLLIPADETLVGSEICASVSAEHELDPTDVLLPKTRDETCSEVRTAAGPNQMQVFGESGNADGPISSKDKVLSYLIRFQNISNDAVNTVRIVDALSEFHNIESVRLGAAGHDYRFNFSDGGALEWTFTDINLPPKVADDVASQGFVKFTVTLKDDLPVGTEIPNSALIYFDSDNPVATNTVVSRIVNTVSSVGSTPDAARVQVFPNPVTDNLSIVLPQRSLTTLRLQNSQGKNLLTEVFDAAAHAINLESLPSGVYFLHISWPAGSIQKSINIVR